MCLYIHQGGLVLFLEYNVIVMYFHFLQSITVIALKHEWLDFLSKIKTLF